MTDELIASTSRLIPPMGARICGAVPVRSSTSELVPGINGGGDFLGRPARSNTASNSPGQNSNTSRCNVLDPSSTGTRNPVATSTRTSRCTSHVLIGDTPGINQVSVRCGQNGCGRSPD